MPNQPHSPSIDELIELPALADPRISPDGMRIAYVVRKPDWKQNEYVSQIWLMTTSNDGKPRQITFAKQSSKDPRWSPDGAWLAFLSKREGDAHTQLYRISVFGGDAECLSEHVTDISAFEWSPDGKSLAFIAPDSESKSEHQRAEMYGEYQVEDEDLKFSHLWLLRLRDLQETRLTQGKGYHVVGFDWHPNGARLAFEGWPTPDEGNFDRARVYLLDLRSFGVSALTDEGCSSPRWSPEGARLAFLHLGTPTFYANNTIRVIHFGRMANQSEVNLAAQPQYIMHAGNILEDAAFAQPSPPQYTVPVKFDEEFMLADWGLDGLYAFAIQRTAIHLFRIDPDDGELERLTPSSPPGWASMSATFDQGFTHAALIASDVEHYDEMVLLDLMKGTLRRLTSYTKLTAEMSLGQNEVFRWNSQDGTRIEGVLTKPNDFDPNRKYPLLVVLHGGPTWVSLLGLLTGYERRYYPIQKWVARGALVLQPNYRGSAGYGEAFRSLNVRNLGLGDYADVISGVDALIKQGWVDPNRMGVMGWSQGGYISAFIATYSDRFRAVSVGAGISNWVTYYTNTDIHPFTRQYLGATPWEDMEVYANTSPMTYIKQAKTPTLIQHGDLDRRVPIPNAYELYQGLRDMGVETRLVTYKGMPHSISKPRQNRQIMQENLQWFNRWLWEEAAEEAPEEVTCYVALAGIFAADNEETAYFQAVQRQARRDEMDFCAFSAQEGLLRPVEPLSDEHVLPPDSAPDQITEVMTMISQQLRAENIRRLVVFLPENHQHDASVQVTLGCLQVAAGLAAGAEEGAQVRFEQRPIRV